jgi:hypothetical protein
MRLGFSVFQLNLSVELRGIRTIRHEDQKNPAGAIKRVDLRSTCYSCAGC